jgi:hypothetical protein
MSDIDALIARLQMQSQRLVRFTVTLIAYANTHPEAVQTIRPIIAELQPDVMSLSVLATQQPSQQLIQAYEAILTPFAVKMPRWRSQLPGELLRLLDSQ